MTGLQIYPLSVVFIASGFFTIKLKKLVFYQKTEEDLLYVLLHTFSKLGLKVQIINLTAKNIHASLICTTDY